MSDAVNLWKNIVIDEELREFIVLSPKDINELTAEAMKTPNPSAKLTELLNERGRTKRDTIEAHNQKRMADDLTFLSDFALWPYGGGSCAVKEQPWIKANGRRYGLVYQNDFEAGRFVVHVEHLAMPEQFPTLEELVKVWSVD